MNSIKEEQWINPGEFKTRVDKIKEEAKKAGLFGVVVLGHSAVPENLIYVSNYCLIGVDMTPYSGGFGGGGWMGACVFGVAQDAPTLILDRDYWLDKASRVSWIEDLRYDNYLWGEVIKAIKERGVKGKLGIVADGFMINHYQKFLESLPDGIELVDFNYCLKKLRSIKSPAEISIMKESIQMQTEVYNLIIPKIQDGVMEWEIAEAIRYELRKRGAAHCPSICILSGPNSECSLATPQATNRVIRDGDMVLITVFSYYKNYTTGIDRPFVCGKTASEKAKKLSEIELKGLEKCLSIMEPGLPVKDMYAPVYYDYIIPELDKAGFKNYKVQGYMGHATGLSLAEPPMLNPRDETVLQPGMVVHVEPGIYLTGQNMGLRTAEMVEITDKGINVLTKDMPRRSGSLA